MRIPAKSLAVLAVTAMLTNPSWAAGGVDDLRVRQLENDLMRLQRELDAQSRRIEELERSQRNAGIGRPASPAARPSDSSPGWLLSANWDRVRPGMKETDVIALLGRPTSVRTDGGKIQALMYAMEIGPNAILAGNVRMGDAGVAEINRPTLR
jgi:hypothetical protein